MNITFYNTVDELNKMNKELTNNTIINCNLIYPFDIIKPQIKLSADNELFNYLFNYLSFTSGNKLRYYFITDIRLENNVIYVNTLEDALMTWKDDILNSYGHITRSFNNNNPYLQDKLIYDTNKVNRTYKKIGNGFETSNQYILTIGG